jgi:hypothetical protein
LDVTGAIVWQNTIGGSLFDDLHAIKETGYGGYILGRHSRSDSSGDKSEDSLGSSDYWIICLNDSGNIIWGNTIGGSGQDEMSEVIITNDGGFLVAGWSSLNISHDKLENSIGGFDFWLLKFTASGLVQDQNTIGGNGPDLIRDIIQSSNGGIVVNGHSFSNISEDKTENSNGLDDYWAVGLSGSLGVEVNTFSSQIKIDPNPIRNLLNIDSFENDIDTIKIVDAKGVLVVSLVDVGVSPIVSAASLPTGIYFLQITSKRKTSVIKFIKRQGDLQRSGT